MEVELIPASESDQDRIYNLWHYYIYDMSEFTGQNPSPEGIYVTHPSEINAYWERDDHQPFVIQCDGELAGFSLIRRFPADPTFYDINAFFVLRKYKRAGVGRTAFGMCVAQLPGKWLARVMLKNTGALKFWLTVIGEITNGEFAHTTEIHVSDYGQNEMHFIRYEIKKG